MKRLISLLTILVLVLTLGVTSFDDESVKKDEEEGENKVIIVQFEKEIDFDKLNEEYEYIIRQELQTKSICYWCGNPGMYLDTSVVHKDRWIKPCACIVAPWSWWDQIDRYEYTTTQKCNYCQYSSLVDRYNKYTNHCSANGNSDDFMIKEGKLQSQGWDWHRCPESHDINFVW